MTTAATIAAQLMLDASGFTKGMKDSEKAAESFEKKMERVGKKMQKIGATMSIALTLPIAAALKQGVDMASAYEESLSKVNVVFEESGAVIEKWSKDAAKNLGLSQQEALEAAGTYGNLFTAQGMATDAAADMSMALVQLSADLASFNNANPEEVLLALRSGLSGEVEPLKKFGIAMNQAMMQTKAMEMGLGDNIQALTESEKIQVRYAIIMEQTAKAQGDFARTSGGLANQQRILSAQFKDSLRVLGQNLLPIVLKVVQGLNSLLEKFNAAPPFVQKAVLALLVLLALAGPIISFIGTILTFAASLSTLGISLAGIGTFITATLIPAIVALLPVLALVAAAALLVYMVWSNWDTLKVTLEQLWFIIKWGFQQAINAVVTGFQDGMKSIQDKARPVADFLKKTWSNIKMAFQSAFMAIVSIAMRVFNTIRNAILVVVTAIAKLKAAFASIKLPPALTPGSPTPFEMGLRGINKQMSILSAQSMPHMQTGFANLAPVGVTGVGGGRRVNYVDNSRYEAGVTPDVLKLAMQNQTLKLAKALE